MNLHLGTMGWSYNFWRGSFYPEKMVSKDFLSFYAKQLNSVEADSTFYRIPSPETVGEWKHQTPGDFMFSLKFPQRITHVKMLKDCQEETKVFLERMTKLEDKLGALLLQFPPMFRQQHLPVLADYLETLPKQHRYAVEVRNKSLLHEEFFKLLRSHNVALVWVDTPKMPHLMEETADFLYVRWEGDRKVVKGTLGKIEVNRTQDIEGWGEQLKMFLKKKPVFGYFSKYFSGNPTSDAKSLLGFLET